MAVKIGKCIERRFPVCFSSSVFSVTFLPSFFSFSLKLSLEKGKQKVAFPVSAGVSKKEEKILKLFN